jgi:hypothetical protein
VGQLKGERLGNVMEKKKLIGNKLLRPRLVCEINISLEKIIVITCNGRGYNEIVIYIF